jgi:putative oxygen-independent coproporphyrinogen III oxidase
LAEDWEAGGFALYVHWPFCQAKCPYCDFNSHVVAQVDQDAWANAFQSEIARVAALTGPRSLRSIFFGGGTPSLMEPRVVGAVLEAAARAWHMPEGIEITLEANPTSVEAERFAAYRALGVNRLSLGVQSLRAADLRALGRLHSVEEALAALRLARATFERVNFDLIYARQEQSLADWQAELQEALSFGPDHLSLYQLTIEDGTAFGERFARGGLRGLPDEDLAADLYDLTQEMTGAAGLPAYEVSNHARPGQEGQHNLVYWRSGDYAGIGPGAHGRLTIDGTRQATEAVRQPWAWLAQVDTLCTGEVAVEVLDRAARLSEFLLMGLRLVEGVDVARLAWRAGPDVWAKVDEAVLDGLLMRNDARVALSRRGRPLLNAVLARLLRD